MAGRSNQPGRTVAGKISMILLAIFEGSRTLTEIAMRCELPLSTVHRLTTDLAAWRLLERADDGTYRAGTPLRTIGRISAAADDLDDPVAVLRDCAVPIMEDLVRAIGVSARVGVLDNALSVAYVQKDSLHEPVSRHCPAARLPAHASALGKALLAFSPPQMVDALLARGLRPYTPFTITNPQLMRATLRTIRATRLAVCDRELRPDSCALAAPVFGVGGHVVAAIELQTTALARDVAAWRPALVVAAGTLSRDLARHLRCRQAALSHHTGGRRIDLGVTGA
jgi:DNA-binding IclR family transcriptional regulator